MKSENGLSAAALKQSLANLASMSPFTFATAVHTAVAPPKSAPSLTAGTGNQGNQQQVPPMSMSHMPLPSGKEASPNFHHPSNAPSIGKEGLGEGLDLQGVVSGMRPPSDGHAALSPCSADHLAAFIMVRNTNALS